jgi:hypothetical protein
MSAQTNLGSVNAKLVERMSIRDIPQFELAKDVNIALTMDLTMGPLRFCTS